MSTRSFIARKTEDASFEGVYCHWDGYPEHNGTILEKHYASPAKVRKLLAPGDMSSLNWQIGRRHRFDSRRNRCYTTYYGRDRGETDVQVIEPKRYGSLRHLMDYAEKCGCEYFYLFEDNRWHVAERDAQYFGMSDGSRLSPLQPLTEALAKVAKTHT